MSSKTAKLLTCSMEKDLDLARMLFRTVDDHVSPDIEHIVVVPAKSIPAFKQFGSNRRQIVAQEDVLPERFIKLPASLSHLSHFAEGFRRPLYLSRGPRLVRGWVLQQMIKLEFTRNTSADAVVHTDSDVAFIKPFGIEDVFIEGLPRFFSVAGDIKNPLFRQWCDTAGSLLDIEVPAEFRNHFVGNCIVWSPSVVRALYDAVEQATGQSLCYQIKRLPNLSEYTIYGVFAELSPLNLPIRTAELPLCFTVWHSNQTNITADHVIGRLKGPHRAFAIQSTVDLPIGERARLIDEVTHKLYPMTAA